MTASYQAKDELLSALKWQIEMGIDCALGDTAEGLYAAQSVQPASQALSSSNQPVQNQLAKAQRPASVLRESPAPPPQFVSSEDAARPAGITARITAGDVTSIQTLDDLKAALTGV